MSELLKLQGYSELSETKRLIALCRKDIVETRLKLATGRAHNQEERNALWTIVDSREWFLKMVAKDYLGELEQIDRELEAGLIRD